MSALFSCAKVNLLYDLSVGLNVRINFIQAEKNSVFETIKETVYIVYLKLSC